MPKGKRASTVNQMLLEAQRRRVIKKIATLGDLRAVSKKLGVPVQELAKIRNRMLVNMYARGASIERLSKLFRISKPRVESILGSYKRNTPEAKAIRRRQLLDWARTQNPKSLAFGRMFKEHPRKLSEIIYAFSHNTEEAKKNRMLAYERFLAELGLNRQAVGMRRRSAGSREEIRKRLLEYLSKPRSTKSLMYSSGEDVKVTRGIASNYVIYSILRELIKKGQIKKTRILRRVYYYKPGQESDIKRLRERAVSFALNSLEKGRTSLSFTLEDAKLAILMRLERPLSAREMHWIETDSGTGVRLCSEQLLKSALSSLMGEGKLLSRYVGHKKYYFKPEQMEELKQLVEEHQKARKKSSK